MKIVERSLRKAPISVAFPGRVSVGAFRRPLSRGGDGGTIAV